MYYVLSSSSRPRRRIKKRPFIKKVSWWKGAVISEPLPDPLELSLGPYCPFSADEDQYMGAIIYTNPPIWRDDFIQALRECGVHNFDTYDVAISNPDNQELLADFYQQLREGGVKDIDQYLKSMGIADISALKDPNPDTIITNYKAVNILGLVAAADMEASVATVHDGIPFTDVDFDCLVLDEKKTNNIKMFRLAESTNTILVHESLRNALLEKGFGSDVEFYDLKDAAI